MKRMATFGALAALAFAAGGARPQAAAPASGQAVPTAPPSQSAAPPAPVASSTCEAASLAWLVGHPRTDIPVPVEPSHRRVSCTTCPVTMDYLPARTDIIYDEKTDLIVQVKCG